MRSHAVTCIPTPTPLVSPRPLAVGAFGAVLCLGGQALGAAWRGFLTRYSYLLLRQACVVVQAWARGCWARRRLHGSVHVTLVRGVRLREMGPRGKQSPVVRVGLVVTGAPHGPGAEGGIAVHGGRDPVWAPTRGEGLVALPFALDRAVTGAYRVLACGGFACGYACRRGGSAGGCGGGVLVGRAFRPVWVPAHRVSQDAACDDKFYPRVPFFRHWRVCGTVATHPPLHCPIEARCPHVLLTPCVSHGCPG
jgi:hypothetical protein